MSEVEFSERAQEILSTAEQSAWEGFQRLPRRRRAQAYLRGPQFIEASITATAAMLLAERLARMERRQVKS